MKNSITYKQWLQKKLGNVFKVVKATEDTIEIKIPCINNLKMTDRDYKNVERIWGQYREEMKVEMKKKPMPLTTFLRNEFDLDCYIDKRKDHYRMKPKWSSATRQFRKIKKALEHVKGVEVEVVELWNFNPYYRRDGEATMHSKYKQLVIRTTKRPSEIIVKPIKK